MKSKFKFKPQTALLIGGLLAVTYSEACWYAGTTAICYVSGDTVDEIDWPDSSGTSYVTATGDFTITAPANDTYAYPGTGAGGHTTLSNFNTPINSQNCIGSAQFKDRAGHTTSLSSWMNNAASKLTSYYPPNFYENATPSGSTCSM